MSQYANEPSGETLADIVSGDGGGLRRFAQVAWIVGGLAVLALVAAVLKPIVSPRPLAERARDFVQLPADAEVLSIGTGPGPGDVDVSFRLSEPRGLGSREQEVWSLNYFPMPLPVPPVTTPAGKSPPTTGAAASKPRSRRAKVSVPYSPYSSTLSGTTYRYSPPYAQAKVLSYDSSTGRYTFRAYTP